MQHRPRYRLMRRILYPYNGEQPLSLRQSLRVLFAWMLFFPLTMALLALVLTIIELYPVQKICTVCDFIFPFRCLHLWLVWFAYCDYEQ